MKKIVVEIDNKKECPRCEHNLTSKIKDWDGLGWARYCHVCAYIFGSTVEEQRDK